MVKSNSKYYILSLKDIDEKIDNDIIFNTEVEVDNLFHTLEYSSLSPLELYFFIIIYDIIGDPVEILLNFDDKHPIEKLEYDDLIDKIDTYNTITANEKDKIIIDNNSTIKSIFEDYVTKNNFNGFNDYGVDIITKDNENPALIYHLEMFGYHFWIVANNKKQIKNYIIDRIEKSSLIDFVEKE